MNKLEEIWERVWQNRRFINSENILIKGNKHLFGRNTVFDGKAGIEIEEDVEIGYNTCILSRSSIGKTEGKIVLKKNCKIGANVVIMPGVEVGENSIIGAGAVVSKFTRIPSNEIWTGIPARKLKDLENKSDL